MKAIGSFFSVILLLVFSCKPQQQSSANANATANKTTPKVTKDANPSQQKTASLLLNQKWRATELFGVPVQGIDQETQEVFLRLGADGQFQASGGCNSISGQYILSGKNMVQFGEMIANERECMTHHFDEQLRSALRTAEQYLIVNENEMHLMVGKRAPLAKFQVEHVDY